MSALLVISLIVLITKVNGQTGVCTEIPETAQSPNTPINSSVQVNIILTSLKMIIPMSAQSNVFHMFFVVFFCCKK